MPEHYSQKEAQSLDRQISGYLERRKRQKFMLSEIMGGVGGGLAIGYLTTKNPGLNSFGPGGRFNIDQVVALAGLFLGRKATRVGAMSRGAGIGSANHIAREYGVKAAT